MRTSACTNVPATSRRTNDITTCAISPNGRRLGTPPTILLEGDEAVGTRRPPRGQQPQRIVTRDTTVANVITRQSRSKLSCTGKNPCSSGNVAFEEGVAPSRKQEAACPTRDGEHEALRQKLLQHSMATGAQRPPQREFSLSHGSANEEQIADVHARNQQHQADDDGEESGNDLGTPPVRDIRNATDVVRNDWSCHRLSDAFTDKLRVDEIELTRDHGGSGVVAQSPEEHQKSTRTVLESRRHRRPRGDRNRYQFEAARRFR